MRSYKKGRMFLLAGLMLSILVTVGWKGKDRYNSTPLLSSDITSYPEEWKINGLTRISHDKAYCIPTCMQMIGEWAGVVEPIEYYTWLTGFSSGGFYKDNFVTFMPISDAMMGITFGSGYLGLERILYGTTDPVILEAGIKSALSKGYPVMILYDYNAKTGASFFFPHAAVLTGYTEKEFLYFEPSFSDTYVPEETHHDSTSIDTFLKGIESFHKNMGLSQGYHFMVFKPSEKRTDTEQVWIRNGKELKGINIPLINISTGSKAVLALSSEIRKGKIPFWGWKNLLPVWFSFGEYSRKDNADFIEQRFGCNGIYGKIAEHYRNSAVHYGKICAIINDPAKTEKDYIHEIPPLLARIASEEKETGILMLKEWK